MCDIRRLPLPPPSPARRSSAHATSARQSRSSFDPNKFEFLARSVSTLDPRRFGISIAIASFAELWIESKLQLETYTVEWPRSEIAPDAANYPFIYSADDRIDLGRMLERHHTDPADRLGTWARAFVRGNRTDTLALLADLNAGVKSSISYQSRETEGTQTPVETLNRGSGSCRDLAMLLIETARCL